MAVNKATASVRTFSSLQKSVIQSIEDTFPIETNNRILRVSNVQVDTSSVDPLDYKAQKEVKIKGKDYVAPVYADVEIVDKETGDVIDSKKKFRIMDLPVLTDRHSFILGGNEYSVDKQLRMKPGIYTREKENGELESQFNLAKGGGRGFKMWLNPEDGIFKLKIGTANPPLYPILKALGVDDGAIKGAWGDSLFTLNQSKTAKSSDKDIMRAYKAIFMKDAKGIAEAQSELKDFFDKTIISKETTQRTLGKGFDKVEPETLLLTSKRLLKVSRGEEEPDDRDSLIYKHIYDTPDLIEANIAANKRKIQYDVKRILDKKNKVTEVISKDMMNKPVRSFFVQGSVANSAEQTNPTTILSNMTKVTSLGEGAIGDMNAITESMRMVNTSHAGVLDPVATPECLTPEAEIYTKSGWVRADEVSLESEVLCIPDGCAPDMASKTEFRKPERVLSYPYNGILYGMDNGLAGYLVTPNHKVVCKPYEYRINKGFRKSLAEDMHGKTRMFPIKHQALEGDASFTHKVIGEYTVPIDDWAEFMGWFLSEGSASIINKHLNSRVRLSQSKNANPDKYEKIATLVDSLPFGKWVKNAQEVYINNTTLNDYLVQFGYCDKKFIPEDLFNAPISARKRLFDSLLLGDGRTYSKRVKHSYKQQVYTTTSPQLAKDFERLAVELGYPVSIKIYSDNREEHYLDVYEIRVMQRKGCVAHDKKGHYYTREYDGNVHCVTVPGGMFLMRMPGKIGIWTGNSDRIGINLHLALGADISNKELRTYVWSPVNGNKGFAYVKDLFDKKVAFPDQYKEGKPKSATVTVMHQGKITQVPAKEVEAVLYSPKQMMGYLSNLVPFMANVQGNRAFMANKMLAQAIPLKYREEPLIQTKAPSGGTFEKFVGNMFSTTADKDGIVKKVTYDSIVVDDGKGNETEYPLYNNFPLNNKSFVHSEPLIKEGDKVKAGQTLADTVYTKNGTLSIGTNLRVGILPFRDNTFEDGYVISETASKKLTSEHLREVSVQVGREDLTDLKAFKAHYPTAITGPMMSKLDPDGVVRRGEIVEPGDVIIAHLQKTEAMPEDAKLGKLSKRLVKGYRNNAQIWDKETSGRVVDVFKDGHNIKVFIRTEEPMQIGDKIVNRHGAKGIVSAVIPDAEMPADKDGNPIEVAVSPSAIPGRINPSQVLETAASKVALKLGRPLKIDNFAEINSVKEIKKLLKENNLPDKEELIDPTTGQSLGKVMVGNQYYLKLMHQVSKKINARGAGPNYDIDLQPSKGGHGSAQAMDRLTWNSMVAHGARENLYEMTAYKAEQNPELWRNVKLGYPLPAPKTPFVFNKLIGYLAAGGVNVKKDGSKMYLMPITDKEILERSNGEIEDAKVVISKNLRPVQDGLFDEVKTGGLSGTKWTHIKLAEPILNPVMENAAMSLLDITKKQLDSIVEGKSYFNPETKEITTEPVGLTAGKALEAMLGNVDVNKEYEDLKSRAVGLTGQGLNKANKKLRFLRALRLTGSSAKDAYMIHNVPVLPPKFRPMYPMADGSLNHAPINYLYRDLIMVNKQLKDLSFLDDEMKTDLRRDMYRAVKATQGIGDPLVQRGEKKIIGAIELIKGAQPKEGYFQSIVFSKNQDLSGRSTITPSTEMSPDEMMMPKDMAWKLYQPFIVKELTKMGHRPLDASVMVNNKDPRAELALQKVSQERPVWLNRAPSLHKFSILAMQPKLYEGKSIKIHPLVVGGYTADFDGDTMAVHVPISHKAIEEAKNYLPTRVLEHAADNRVMLSPGHDIMTGMFYLTRSGGQDLSSKRKYASIDEALKDYKTKSIEMYDDVMIGGIKTTIGKELVRAELPPDILIPEGGLNKGTIKGFLKELSKKGPDTFRDVMDKLSKLAAKYNIYSSISIGLDDLEPDYTNRDKIVNEVKAKLNKAKTDDEKRNIISGMLPKFHATVNDYLAANPNNALSQLMRANGKPSFDQFKQLISTPFAVSDEKGNAVPLVTTKSFSEGLPVSEYWTTTYGSRAGMIQKRLATADPGYFAKQVISVTIDNVISMDDCGTTKGVQTSMEDKGDIIGRYEAGTNVLIDDDRYTSLLKSGTKNITLRSPLTCEAKEGTCSKCYGLRENGQPAKTGDNVGALAGQFFTEPTTQGSMKAFHCMDKGMLLLIRRNGKDELTSFEDLWNSVDATIENVDGQEEKLIADLEVWDDGGFTKVEGIIRHKREASSSMVFTRSQSNKFIVSQDNHPHMLCEHGNDEFKMVEPKDINKSSYLCKATNPPIWADEKIIPFYPAYYIGLFVTDGSLCYHDRSSGIREYNGVALYQNQDSIVHDMCKEAMEALPYEGTIHTRTRTNKGGKTGVVFTKYGRDLGELFFNKCGANYYDKHLPYEFIKYSDVDLAKALCGIIDGDGCVIPMDGVKEHRTCINIELSSLPLIQQIGMICDRLALTYRVSVCTVRPTSRRQSYKVMIYPKPGEQTHFHFSRKMRQDGTYNNSGNLRNSDKIDYVKEIYFDDRDYVYDLTTKTHTLSVNGMWTHNTGAVLGSGAQVAGGLDRLRQLTLVPDYLKDKATLAKVPGRVTRIEDNPAGGKNIYVGDEKHLAGVRNILKVKEGDDVQQGDALTDGPVKPQELLALKGIDSTQKYLVDSMKDTFKGMGVNMNRKLIETVVRSATNSTTIEDPGDHPYYVPGDIAPLTEIRSWNSKNQNEIPVEDAVGAEIASGAGPYRAGTVLDLDKIKALKTLGITKVIVKSSPIKHSPSIVSVDQLARMGGDWLAKLNTNYLEKIIVQGAQTRDKTELSSYNPTGPYVLATGFGKGEKGKY